MATSLKLSYCCVYGCQNSTFSSQKMSYFQLPADVRRRSEWLRLISREDLSHIKSCKSYRVCEEHFNKPDIIPNPKRRKLKKNAIPCLNLPDLAKNDKETQTQVCNFVQREILTVTNYNTAQTSASLSDTRKRKLESDISEDNVQKDTVLEFYKLCDKFLTKELATLVKAQHHLNFHITGNRYHQDYILFCLNLFYTSPQAYRLLRCAMCLPCPSTLSKYYIPVTTEINERMMLILKTKVESMSEQEKNCSILVATISLKESLFYDIKADKIIGFHEIEGMQTSDPAKNALVVEIRGIFSNWKQPIAFALLSESRNYDDIAKWIDRLLEKLFESGLNIRTFVSDMGSDLLKAERKRSVTIDKPYFFINQRKIYYIFDAPHLVKSVRNNLMLYDFHFNDKVAKYEHIVQFYNQDKQKNFKLAPKLTNSHINPSNFEKMQVCYATQLLSNSVATGIAAYVDFKLIDETGKDTVELVQLMNNLFDALNSSTLKDEYDYRRAFCGNESQISFFKEMLIFFQCLKLINPKNGLDVTTDVNFIQGFQITIKSILLLFEDLKLAGHNFLPTRQLNQDTIEKFYDQIRTRNGLSTEPTSRQFVSAFRKLFYANIIKPPKGGNSADDSGKVLLQSDRLEPQNNEKASNEHNDINLVPVTDDEEVKIKISTSAYKGMKMPENNSLVYVCGYLLRKCGEIHKDCYIFKSYFKPMLNQKIHNFSADTRYLRYNDYSKDSCSNLLFIPPDDFVNYVEKMEERFQSTLIKKHINCKILASIFKEIKEINLSPLPCPCFPKTFLIKLFIRMSIFYVIKYNNKSFRTCRNRRNFFSITDL